MFLLTSRPMPVPPPVYALAGPTASGKSAAALALAERLDAEIVSVDSAQVYLGMYIGTAKPSAAERAAIPHHLVDIRDPSQAYSAADFARDAQAVLAAIQARGRPAVLAGGTMLYFKALFEGLDAMPAADPSLRAALDAEAALKGWPAMHAELAAVDPVTAQRLAPADSQRIQRALEVYRATGRPLSAFHAARQTEPRLVPRLFLSLEPPDRSWLHERIERRFDDMLAAGLVDEVRRLRARGDLSLQLPSMRSVGYRQAWELLDEHEATGAPLRMDELRLRGIHATRQLAKRQLTWLRSMPQRRVIACDAPGALDEVLAAAGRAA
jgi:tRNA dimethylallyltransferase